MKCQLSDLVPNKKLRLTYLNNERKTACDELQTALEVVLCEFSEKYPTMPVAVLLGVLRIVDKNAVDRWA